MIKAFFYNAMNSWVTSGAGAIIGGPNIVDGLNGVFDSDVATGIGWQALLTGIAILFMGMMTRDHTKAWIKEPK